MLYFDPCWLTGPAEFENIIDADLDDPRSKDRLKCPSAPPRPSFLCREVGKRSMPRWFSAKKFLSASETTCVCVRWANQSAISKCLSQRVPAVNAMIFNHNRQHSGNEYAYSLQVFHQHAQQRNIFASHARNVCVCANQFSKAMRWSGNPR